MVIFHSFLYVYQRVRHFEPKWWHGSSGSTILRNHQIWNVMKHPCDKGLPFTFCLILGRIDKETNVFEPSTSRCPVENRKPRKWVRVSLCHKLEPFPSHKQGVLQKLDPNFVHCQRSNIFPTSLQDLHCLSWTNITLCLCRSVCDHFYFSILMLSFFGALAQLQQAIIRDRCRLHNLIIRQVGPMLSQQRCQLHQTRWIATRFHEGHILTVESETEAQRTVPCISHHTHWTHAMLQIERCWELLSHGKSINFAAWIQETPFLLMVILATGDCCDGDFVIFVNGDFKWFLANTRLSEDVPAGN